MRHVRNTQRPRDRARAVLAVASVAAMTIACGTFWHGSGSSLVSTSGAVLDVMMQDANHGWVRTARTLLRTDDGGVKWQAAPLLAGLDLGQISVVAGAAGAGVWLCEQGAAQGSSPVTPNPEGDPRNQRTPLARCFASGDGGRTWTSGTVPDSASTFTARTRLDAGVISLTAVDGGQAWAVLRTVSSFAGGGHESIDLRDLSVLRTADGGVTWTVVRRRTPAADGTPNTLTGLPWVRFVDTRTGWLGGFLPGRLEVTHDGGITWRTAPAPVPAKATASELVDLRPITLLPDGGLVEPVVAGAAATSYRVTVLASIDGGRSWTASPVDVGRTPAPQVDALDGQRWWLSTGTTLRATADSGDLKGGKSQSGVRRLVRRCGASR